MVMTTTPTSDGLACPGCDDADDPFVPPGSSFEEAVRAHLAWIYEEFVPPAYDEQLARDALNEIWPHIRRWAMAARPPVDGERAT